MAIPLLLAKSLEHKRISAVWIGVIGGVLSAILYTVTNICLRSLGHIDAIWVSTVKACPTLLIVFPLFVQQLRQGTHFRPTTSATNLRKELKLLAAISIFVQIFGNIAFQTALSILGLTISVPIVLGTMLIGGALTGKMMLGEPVSRRKVWSIFILILATCVLSYSASQSSSSRAEGSVSEQQNSATAPEQAANQERDKAKETRDNGQATTTSPWRITFGLAANIAAGIAYAIQSTLMRRSMKRGVSAWTTLVTLNSIGIAFLLSCSFLWLGPSVLAATTASDFGIMIAAGIFNALAFMAMAKSLQHVSVLFVQLLNASQAAISALAGFLLFGEQITTWVLLGIFLTSLGLLVAGMRDELKSETEDGTASNQDLD